MRLPIFLCIAILLLAVFPPSVSALDFSDILGTRSRELERIYKTRLPGQAGDEVKNPQASSNTTTSGGETIQSENQESDSQAVGGAAGGYTINRGVQNPILEGKAVTTDLPSFFAEILKNLEQLIGIGSEEAQQFADTNFPFGVGEKVVRENQAFNIKSEDTVANASNESVLGLFDENQSMARSLEVVKCSVLPAGLCRGNIIRGGPLEAPILPPDTSSDTSYVGIPYYKTDESKATVIDQLVPGVLGRMESQIVPTFKNTYPTSLIDSWRRVFDASYKNGFDSSDPPHMWNPLFVLAIWVEETHASDACGLGKDIWDLGVVSLPKTTCNDPQKQEKFEAQLSRFVGLIGNVQTPKTIDQFMCKFALGVDIGSNETCQFKGTENEQFFYNLPKVYFCLLNGTYPDDCDTGGGGGGSVDLLVSDIQKNCKAQVTNDDGKTYIADGIVNVVNISCLDRLNTDVATPYSDSVLTELKSFHDGVGSEFDNIQCVGFARAAFLHESGKILPAVDRAVDIRNLTSGQLAGYKFVAKKDVISPNVGDLAVWDTTIDPEVSGFKPSPDGHTGFVVEVYGTTSFRVAEGNWGPRGKVRNDRIIPVSYPQIIGWLQKSS
ncbi:CHAP domain-containing protein [Candidatus Gottesmanbacteria bacterium]|nr:CHAP domain-containing protein [Candidatus Gottesmanbacteria bacterium]